jgi:hypothetical protein
LAVELDDLGLGGARLIATEPLASGTPLQLRIDAPQLWEPLVLSCRVAWSRLKLDGNSQLGVRFESCTPASIVILAELLSLTSRI